MRISALPLVLMVWTPAAHAFPEMVRHGYTNCVTCHLSPTGGGILNEYGRAIASEVLSRGNFFFEDRMPLEIPAAPEAAAPKAHFLLGGDVRALQLVDDSPTETKGRFIFMQADLEGAFTDGKRLTVDLSVGRAEPAPKDPRNKLGDWLVSRRHWISFKLGPDTAVDEFQVRAGRFFPAYGINIPEHTNVTRALLGFDQQQETYNAELAYITETWNATATYIAGRPDNLDRSQEKGAALQVSRSLGDTFRVGVNAFYGNNPSRVTRPVRKMGGVFGLLGFSSRVYALTDWNLTYDQLNHTGLAEFIRFGWEFSQGVHLVAEQQEAKVSFSSPKVFLDSYTLGLEYFPRLHWEFDASGGVARNTASSTDFHDVWLLLAHYYL